MSRQSEDNFTVSRPTGFYELLDQNGLIPSSRTHGVAGRAFGH